MATLQSKRFVMHAVSSGPVKRLGWMDDPLDIQETAGDDSQSCLIDHNDFASSSGGCRKRVVAVKFDAERDPPPVQALALIR